MNQTKVNKHGLPRNIPSNIKYQVRIKSGFGCVICGNGIIEYEHIEPEYKDAFSHDPNGITLLCPTCHAKKTRGFLSKETIKRAMLRPKALQRGFTKEVLDIGDGFPKVRFAGSTFQKCTIPIRISGIPIFQIKPPETINSPFRLSAIFFDSNGFISMQIEENEWIAYTTNWDIEAIGGKLIIRNEKKIPHLILKTINADTIEVEHIISLIGDTFILGDRDKFRVLNARTGRIRHIFSNCLADNCYIGIDL